MHTVSVLYTCAEGECGQSKYPDAGEYDLPSSMIVGGIEAREHEFPWQVSQNLFDSILDGACNSRL
jgi:hypothetical protein